MPGETGPVWLTDVRVADLVAESILLGACGRQFYELHAWVVMPNHAHMLILPLEPVREAMRWLKGSTACGANRILGRTGHEFWRRDFFDHYLRSSGEVWKFIDYIEANPVRAGLVCRPGDWRSSAGWKVRSLAGGTARPTYGGGSTVR